MVSSLGSVSSQHSVSNIGNSNAIPIKAADGDFKGKRINIADQQEALNLYQRIQNQDLQNARDRLQPVPVYYVSARRFGPFKSHGYAVAGTPGQRGNAGAQLYCFGGDPKRITMDITRAFVNKVKNNSQFNAEVLAAVKVLKGKHFPTGEAFHLAYQQVRRSSQEDISDQQLKQEVRGLQRLLSRSNMEVWVKQESGLFPEKGLSVNAIVPLVNKKSLFGQYHFPKAMRSAVNALKDNHYSHESAFHQAYVDIRKALEPTVTSAQIGQELSKLYRKTPTNNQEQDLRAFEKGSINIRVRQIKYVNNLELLEQKQQVQLHQRYLDEKLGRVGTGLAEIEPANLADADITKLKAHVPMFSGIPMNKNQANCNSGVSSFIQHIIDNNGSGGRVKPASIAALGFNHQSAMWKPMAEE